MAYREDINTGAIAYIGLVSTLAVLVIVLFLRVMYYSHKQELVARYSSGSQPSLLAIERSNVLADQQAKLTVPRLVDKERGIVTIPIDRAMELVVAELNAGKSPSEVIGPSLPDKPVGGRINQ